MLSKKSTILALLALQAFSSAPPPPEDFGKCVCDATAFMSSHQDQRLCLKKADDHGIANCEEYDFSATYGKICTKCSATHAVGLNGLECHEHGLNHCIRAQIKGGTDFGDYTFECLECDAGKQVDETLNPDSCIANPDPAVPKCEKYVKTSGGQKCIKCDGTSYLKNSARENGCTDFDIPNCSAHEKVDEQNIKCTACESSHPLLQEDGSRCHVAGTGIGGCETYKHDGALKCKTCESDKVKWTGENGCTTPPSNIGGCVKYATANGSSWVCAECDGNTVISNNAAACNAPQSAQDAMNCQVYKTSGTWTCKECKSSHPILQTNEQICHATPTNAATAGGANRWTENCAEWSHDNTNYSCTKCNAHYILDGLKCKKTERDIEHCESYSDLHTCSSCAEDYALEHNTCWKCPDEIYVPPTPVTCPSNQTPTPNPTPTNGTNSSGALLNAGIMFLLALVMF